MTDTAHSSWITDHAFEPRTEPVLKFERRGAFATGFTLPANPALCKHCDLAEAAHQETTR